MAGLVIIQMTQRVVITLLQVSSMVVLTLQRGLVAGGSGAYRSAFSIGILCLLMVLHRRECDGPLLLLFGVLRDASGGRATPHHALLFCVPGVSPAAADTRARARSGVAYRIMMPPLIRHLLQIHCTLRFSKRNNVPSSILMA
jgi:hypothetical protein